MIWKIFLCYLLASTFAWARLGESPEECAARYGGSGTPSNSMAETMNCDKAITYHKGGLILDIGFLDGKAAYIYITNPNVNFSPAQALEIEDTESDGHNWSKIRQGDNEMSKNRDDDQVFTSSQMDFSDMSHPIKAILFMSKAYTTMLRERSVKVPSI